MIQAPQISQTPSYVAWILTRGLLTFARPLLSTTALRLLLQVESILFTASTLSDEEAGDDDTSDSEGNKNESKPGGEGNETEGESGAAHQTISELGRVGHEATRSRSQEANIFIFIELLSSSTKNPNSSLAT
jgi:hypothetical protein